MAGIVDKKSNYKMWIVWLLFMFAIAIICAIIGYMIVVFNGQSQLKNMDQSKLDLDEASTLYDVNGNVATMLSRENREIVEYKDIPPLLVNTFIATEDRRFREHTGVDLWAIGRAIVKDIAARSVVEGGSTLTQQLAKNILFEHPDQTLFRKATEASTAMALESQYSKDEIITMYLNRIYFGSRAYGVKAAAKVYFAKELKDLEIWQIATLAAIPKSPKNYSPIDFPDKSKDRRQVVLKLMADQGLITEAEKAKAMDINYTAPIQTNKKKEFLTFIDFMMEEAETVYGLDEDKLYRGGYKIYTTMNTDAQRIMEQTYAADKFFQKSNDPAQKIQSSMVIVNHKDGGIVAMIGGRDYATKGLNRVTVKRQPGSAFKPLVTYAPAIETGKWNPYSMLTDEEKDFNGYKPRNIDNNYRGQITMFEAVRRSINLPAVWLLDQIGLSKGKTFVTNLGIDLDPQDNNLAIALGGLTQGATPLQMAQAYGAFANNGSMNKSHSILKITEGDKEVVAYKPEKAKQVMSAKTAYYTTLLLQGVVEPGGTGTAAKSNRPTAGKTGSTQLDIKGLEKNNRDIWFVGYTPEWSAAVWMGYDKTDAKHYVSAGSGLTAAIFKEVISKSLAKVPVKPFVKPNGVPDLKEPPKVVEGLTAVYEVENRKVKLNWTAMEDASTYRLFRKASKDADFVMLLEVKSTTEANDMSVTQGETYQYYIAMYNPETKQEGTRSNVVEVMIPLDGSPSPSPSGNPSGSPSGSPSGGPTSNPSNSPSPDPSRLPRPSDTNKPLATPEPTSSPTPVKTATATPVAAAAGTATPTKVTNIVPVGGEKSPKAN